MRTTENLRILSIFHYIVGGLHAFIGCFGLLHFFMGLSMLLSPSSWNAGREPMPTFFPWIFILFGGGFLSVGVILGSITALSGYFISRRKHRTYSIVVGAINCVMFPFGMALGIFDLILLNREEAIAEYEARSAAR